MMALLHACDRCGETIASAPIKVPLQQIIPGWVGPLMFHVCWACFSYLEKVQAHEMIDPTAQSKEVV